MKIISIIPILQSRINIKSTFAIFVLQLLAGNNIISILLVTTQMLHILGTILVILGGFFIVIGAIGIARFDNFYARLHAASIIDSFGASILLIGVAILQHVVLKIILLIIFIWIASTTACYVLAKSHRQYD